MSLAKSCNIERCCRRIDRRRKESKTRRKWQRKYRRRRFMTDLFIIQIFIKHFLENRYDTMTRVIRVKA